MAAESVAGTQGSLGEAAAESAPGHLVDVVLLLLRLGRRRGGGRRHHRHALEGHLRRSAQWFDLFMFGLTIGGVYALIALGYTMVYGVLRLINFAHGDITMTGAFSAFFLARRFDRSGFLDAHPVLAMGGILMLSMAVCTATALIVERICYRPFRHVATLAPLICAIGASFVLQHTFRGMFGSSVRSYPDPAWMRGRIDFLGFSVPIVQPIVIGTALVGHARPLPRSCRRPRWARPCAPSRRIATPPR